MRARFKILPRRDEAHPLDASVRARDEALDDIKEYRHCSKWELRRRLTMLVVLLAIKEERPVPDVLISAAGSDPMFWHFLVERVKTELREKEEKR